jgi:hypothetical protein
VLAKSKVESLVRDHARPGPSKPSLSKGLLPSLECVQMSRGGCLAFSMGKFSAHATLCPLLASWARCFVAHGLEAAVVYGLCASSL